jgi:hypothetical protein
MPPEPEFEELEGEELLESLCLRGEHGLELEKKFKTAFDVLLKPKKKKVWVSAEKNRRLGYNKLSVRTRQRHMKQGRDDKILGEEVRRKR